VYSRTDDHLDTPAERVPIAQLDPHQANPKRRNPAVIQADSKSSTQFTHVYRERRGMAARAKFEAGPGGAVIQFRPRLPSGICLELDIIWQREGQTSKFDAREWRRLH
jgi:hypothetical protein